MRYQAIIISAISILLTGCRLQNSAPDNCMENAGVKGKMLVIVGEKISVQVLPQNENSLDGKFLATYKVDELVCGKYDKDTISFIAYDHYGYPEFSNYKNAMLFLSDFDSVIYHQKYQFFDVYKTKDGRWASSYHSDDYWGGTIVKPVPIDFTEEVSYNIAGGKKKSIKRSFPEPYYKLTKDKAIAVWGNYIPELFKIKKDGILTARGIFGDPVPGFTLMETQMAEIANKTYNVSKQERQNLRNTFHQFITAIKSKNTQQIRAMSLDSIYCSICEGIRTDYYDNDLDNINVYIDSASQHLQNKEIWGPEDSSYELGVWASSYKTTKPRNFLLSENEKLVIFKLYYFKMEGKKHKYPMSKSHTFQFVKINGHYKFYGMTS